MKRKQLIGLFICSMVPWTIGNGMVALLPIYAVQMGANPAFTGYFMSFAFFSLAIGTPVAGWLADRFQRRKALLFVAALILVPIVYLLGQVTKFWQLVVLTGICWFSAGMSIALVNIMTGLFASEDERGKVFGIIGASIGVAALIGGLTAGPLVDYRGYGFMFFILAVVAIVAPITVFFLTDKKTHREKKIPKKKSAKTFVPAFWLFLSAHLIAVITNGMFSMGRSLSMDAKGFSSTAITSTIAIAGVVMIILPLVLGRLSDRLGRKPLLMLCYVSFVLCPLLLALSKTLWFFWLATAFLAVALASNTIGAALVTDLVPSDKLGAGLSLFQNTFWLGNVVGYAIVGNLIFHLEMSLTLIMGMIPPCVAFVVLSLIRLNKMPAHAADSNH